MPFLWQRSTWASREHWELGDQPHLSTSQLKMESRAFEGSQGLQIRSQLQKKAEGFQDPLFLHFWNLVSLLPICQW